MGEAINYVTYNTVGKLTGGYLQELQPEHEGAYIEVSEEVRASWVKYQANAARDGIEPVPVDDQVPGVPVVPETIAMWQARDELIERDLLDTVNASFDLIPDLKQRARAKSKFEYSSTLRRDDPMLAAMAPLVPLTDAELDELFISASGRV